MNKIKHGVVTHWAAAFANPEAMWIHHWFILSCTTDEHRKTLVKHPTPEVTPRPNILDPIDGFRFEDFVRHVDCSPGCTDVDEDINARRRNVWQWLGRRVESTVEEDPYGDLA